MSGIFVCVSCSEQYSKEDVKHGLYFPSTSTCLDCYNRMQKSKTTCFGKKDKYDRMTIACRDECPDRKICKVFIKLKN